MLILISLEFICDALVNSCKANQAARDLCATASTTASSATPGGAQADAFNKVFGISTVPFFLVGCHLSAKMISLAYLLQNFTSVAVVDNQGNIVSNTGGSSISPSSITGTPSSPATSSSLSTATSAPSSGSCSTPKIIFGANFDGRKETSFEPADKSMYVLWPSFSSHVPSTRILQPWICPGHHHHHAWVHLFCLLDIVAYSLCRIYLWSVKDLMQCRSNSSKPLHSSGCCCIQCYPA